MSHAGGLAAVSIALAAACLASGGSAGAAAPQARIDQRVMALTRQTTWTLVAEIPLRFKTFHPQGMVKIGAEFYLSSVEVRVAPRRVAGGGADAGAGVGHLFKFGADGALLTDRLLGEGDIYHPGGIDYDGRRLWVPVSEYRPDSRAIVYTVDPGAMTAKEALRFDDHIGAVAFDRSRGELRGFSWGSRRSYRWRMGARAGGPAGGRAAAARASTPNRFHYIDYQDCHYVGFGRMLCAGLADYPTGTGAQRFELGGMELIDLRDDRPLWQSPISLRSPAGRPMTQNPFFVEATAKGLRAYFVPDDDTSVLYVYDIAPPA